MAERRAIDFDGFIMRVRQLRGAGWDAGDYPFSLPAVAGWETLDLHPKVTFLVDENGSGK